jgi:NCS1 family nucleobase:cation symporter-1
MPWKLLVDFSNYIFGWLIGYSALLGPIAGIMIADYFVVRKAELKLTDLYVRDGDYEYTNGVNYRAMAALAAGVIVALMGLVIPAVRFLYDYAWFVGFIVSGAIHIALTSRAPQKNGALSLTT